MEVAELLTLTPVESALAYDANNEYTIILNFF